MPVLSILVRAVTLSIGVGAYMLELSIGVGAAV